MHVVLTGRRCPEEIIELADTVTEMKLIKRLQAGCLHSAALRTELRFRLRTRQPGAVPVRASDRQQVLQPVEPLMKSPGFLRVIGIEEEAQVLGETFPSSTMA